VSIEFNVDAEEMYRACRSFEVVASRDSDLDQSQVALRVYGKRVDILSTCDRANCVADVWGQGTVFVPTCVLLSMLRTLPFFGQRRIQIRFSDGLMRVHSTVFHHRMITIGAAEPKGKERSLDQRLAAHQIA
jgi:hypothetical protein